MKNILQFAAILLLLFSFGNSEADTGYYNTLEYNSILQCASGKPFCFMGYYMNTLFYDEDVTFVPLQCSENSTINHQISIPIQGYFYIYPAYLNLQFIHLYHDCEGVIRRSKHYHPLLSYSSTRRAYETSYNWTIRPERNFRKYDDKYFYIDDALRAKQFQDPKLKQLTFDWLAGEKSALEAINYLKTKGTEEPTNSIPFVPIKSYAIYTTTLVTYNGTLTCGSGERFCAIIYYVEDDNYSYNDDMAFVPLDCTYSGSLNHLITFNMTGGDWWFDYEYDPMLQIFHDCGGMLRIHTVFLKPVSMLSRRATVTYTTHIYKTGIRTARYELKKALRAPILRENVPLRKATRKWYQGNGGY